MPNARGFATVEVTNFPGVLTWRNDNSRSGANSQELVLSPGPGPGMVNSSIFGKLFSCPIDGYAYAQPLYVPSLLIPGSGTNNAILWLIDSSGALTTPNTPAILRAYDPNNLSNEIYNSAMAAASRDTAGLAVKFTLPTVANGKVYVGTQTELDVYGLLN